MGDHKIKHWNVKPGDLFRINTDLSCAEISPRKLLIGDVVMVVEANLFSTVWLVLFEDKVIEFDVYSFNTYTDRLISN